MGIARCVPATASVAGRSAPAAHSRIAGWLCAGTR